MNTYPKIYLQIVSADEKYALKNKNFPNVHGSVLYSNKESLTKVYNDTLNYIRLHKNEFDYVIFMHADVDLDFEHLIKHINECKDKYDIMGLCGASTLNVSQTPLNWWTGSNPTPTEKWGYVNHGQLGNQASFFNAHSPNITDHEAACIDGLCIIFNKNAINSDIMFDEQFKFDQYDTDISLQAILKYKLKLGVLIEKSLQHFSIGKSILTDNFLKTEIILRNKWNLGFPENSRIKMFVDNHVS